MNPLGNPADVSLVLGGPLFQLLRQAHLSDEALMPVRQRSLAGIWCGYVSLPVFQFLLCRWYFRPFIWTRFLWLPDGARGFARETR